MRTPRCRPTLPVPALPPALPQRQSRRASCSPCGAGCGPTPETAPARPEPMARSGCMHGRGGRVIAAQPQPGLGAQHANSGCEPRQLPCGGGRMLVQANCVEPLPLRLDGRSTPPHCARKPASSAAIGHARDPGLPRDRGQRLGDCGRPLRHRFGTARQRRRSRVTAARAHSQSNPGDVGACGSAASASCRRRSSSCWRWPVGVGGDERGELAERRVPPGFGEDSR